MVIELHFPDERPESHPEKIPLRHRWQNIFRQMRRVCMWLGHRAMYNNNVSIQNFKWFDFGDVNTKHDAHTNKFVHFNFPIPNNQ